jgi:3-oxoacyl-[acyl-carrier-protein] synthase-3
MMFRPQPCIVQDKIGAKVRRLRSGRLFRFPVAARFGGCVHRSGIYKRSWLSGETLSKITDWTDRNTCVLFGDGAGAVVLVAEEDGRGILSTHLHTDGSMADLLCIPGGGSQNPASLLSVESGLHFIKMKGNETFKVAVRALEEVVVEALEHNGYSSSDIDVLVPHQANLRIIQATAKRLNLPMEKVVITLNKYGNTSAASVPMALAEAVRDGRIKEGSLVILEAFGGLSWASALSSGKVLINHYSGVGEDGLFSDGRAAGNQEPCTPDS